MLADGLDQAVVQMPLQRPGPALETPTEALELNGRMN
jgi:hypothetical protein